MAVANTSVPFMQPTRAVPYDAATAFASAQTLTADGYVNNIQAQIDLGIGRMEGYLTLDITAMDLASTDETYRFYLLGSNNASWTNGDVEMLAALDLAAVTAGRLVPTITQASPSIPPTGANAERFMIPFCNQRGRWLFRYVQLYLDVGGTTPSITLSAWLSANELM